MPADYPVAQVTALILAGGLGRRVQGLDKGLLPYHGRALAAHVASALSGQASTVLLSANRSHDSYRRLGFDPLPDLRPGFPGPLAGLEAGLAACTTPLLLVCPCDTPHIPGDFGRRLWRSLTAQDADLAYGWDGERDHYLHLLLRADRATDLATFLDSGQRTVRHWLATKRGARADFSVDELANLNTLADAAQ